MNADDRAPAGGGQSPFTPTGADASIRRPGILNGQQAAGQPQASAGGQGPFAPTGSGAPRPQQSQGASPQSGLSAQGGQPGATGQVPQRTAFRTGVPPAGAQPGAGQTGAQPAGGPTGAQPSGAGRPTFAPSGAQPSTDAAKTTGNSPFPTGTQRGTVARPSAGGQVGPAKDTSATALGAPRKVRVLLSSVSPWSALKIGFLLSIAAGIMLVVAVHILWSVLNEMGTLVMIQEWVSKLFDRENEVNILQFVDYTKVMSATLLVAVTNVVLISGLSILGALLYNAVAKVVGGVYMTLTDD